MGLPPLDPRSKSKNIAMRVINKIGSKSFNKRPADSPKYSGADPCLCSRRKTLFEYAIFVILQAWSGSKATRWASSWYPAGLVGFLEALLYRLVWQDAWKGIWIGQHQQQRQRVAAAAGGRSSSSSRRKLLVVLHTRLTNKWYCSSSPRIGILSG